MKSALKNECVSLWQTGVVTWDGVVIPCCFDKDAEIPLGSIAGGDFKTVWQSPEYNGFCSRLLENRKSVPMCKNCTAGLKRNILESEI